MWPVVVVSVQPVGRHVPHFLEGVEHVAVQHLSAVGLGEAFDIGVMGGLAWLDVIEGDALGLRPFGQGIGYEVTAPALVGLACGHQWLLGACRKPFLATPR